jgi:NADH dehydrogenase [ubiquinone] 1 alpha subcomplex assembly factor 7
VNRLAEIVARQGPLSVAEYMALANDAYYATRDPFGRAGDFITAPEISQVFGELLGLWIVQAWHDQGRPRDKRLVELGPGRGTLMADALRAARVVPEFFDGLDIVLVEASPGLRTLQEQALAGYRVRWAQRFDDTDKPLFLLANEFFDALPIRQYVRTARGWRERMVTAGASGALSFALAPVQAIMPPGRESVPEGGVWEISAASTALVSEIARMIAAQGGAALIVDYGYDRPEFGETLQAVARHSFAAILDAPGESDLSAHVDFTALAAAAADAGAEVHGPVTQGALLEDIGVLARFERLARANPAATDTLQAALNRLVAPEHMGALFKALALTPKGAPAPPGF